MITTFLKTLGFSTFSVALLSQCGVSGETRRTVFISDDTGTGDASPHSGESTPDNAGQSSENGQSPGPGEPLPEPETPMGTTLQGAIVRVTPRGLVQGWAVDTEDSNVTVNVVLYVNGDETTGTKIGTVQANGTAFDNNNAGNHSFQFELPVAEKTGTEKQLYVVLESADQQGLLSANGFNFTAYSPKAAGSAFYTSTLLGRLNNSCAGCHPGEVNYDNHYGLLINAAPSEGGTAVLNRLILKASGGLNHGGGNRCGGINNGVCADFQAWWDLEFGG